MREFKLLFFFFLTRKRSELDWAVVFQQLLDDVYEKGGRKEIIQIN